MDRVYSPVSLSTPLPSCFGRRMVRVGGRLLLYCCYLMCCYGLLDGNEVLNTETTTTTTINHHHPEPPSPDFESTRAPQSTPLPSYFGRRWVRVGGVRGWATMYCRSGVLLPLAWAIKYCCSTACLKFEVAVGRTESYCCRLYQVPGTWYVTAISEEHPVLSRLRVNYKVSGLIVQSQPPPRTTAVWPSAPGYPAEGAAGQQLQCYLRALPV